MILAEAKRTIAEAAAKTQDYTKGINNLRTARDLLDKEIRDRLRSNPMRHAREALTDQMLRLGEPRHNRYERHRLKYIDPL